MQDAMTPERWTKFGYKLCAIPPGSKRPVGREWQQHAVPPERFNGNGMGVIHGLSGTCAIDVDDRALTEQVFESFGLDLEEMIQGTFSWEGRPGRVKLLYQRPNLIETRIRKLTKGKHPDVHEVFALRGAESPQKAAQDVLPPTIHPDTGEPYRCLTEPRAVEDLPLPPKAICEMWQGWDEFKPLLAVLIGDECLIKKRRTKPPSEGAIDLVYRFNTQFPVDEVLERNGYERQGRRWLRPGSESGAPGVVLLEDGIVYAHGGDILADDYPHDAFDVFRILEHGGDWASALKEIDPSVPDVFFNGNSMVSSTVNDGLDVDIDRQSLIANTHAADVGKEPTINPAGSDVDVEVTDDTEDGLALCFVEAFPHLRYVPKWGWMIWRETRWERTEDTEVWRLVRPLCRAAAACANKPSEARALRRHKFVADVSKMARTDQRYAATPDQWDAEPMLLNTPAGIVDLKTGEIRKQAPTDYVTKMTAVGPAAWCDRWLQFLNDITAGDTELASFLKRVVGYSLTGLTREHALVFLYGTGGNGKGVFLNTIREIFGDYAKVAVADTFTESKTERHLTELARLRGARLVIAQETESGRRWAEAKLKSVTGGDPITANFMRQDHFEYTPQFQLIVAGNHKPNLRNVDEALRRRFHLVPFTMTIPAERRDPQLPEKLKAEWPGILNWALEGCREYLEQRLSPPQAVVAATKEYFTAEDSISSWIEDRCLAGPEHWEKPMPLFNSWREWCDENGYAAGNQKQFAAALEVRGYSPGKDGAHGGRYWRGLKVQMP